MGQQSFSGHQEQDFETFRTVNRLLGLRTKTSKEQPPACSHKVQGTIISFHDNHATVAPTTDRIHKINNMIQLSLTSNTLTPDKAGELAGKSGFLAQSTFGRVGRAATKAVYARQHEHNNKHTKTNHKLTFALRASLTTLQHNITNSPPRKHEYHSTQTGCPVIYADAFFELGDKQMRTTEAMALDSWDTVAASQYKNGWGIVMFPSKELCTKHFPSRTRQGCGIAVRGEVPQAVLRRYCSRKAFIYFLEAWAQVVAVALFSPLLGEAHIAFCDNEAAKHTLIKGYGKDAAINNLVGSYWAFVAKSLHQPWMERVTSKANWSDEVSRNEWTLAEQNGWTKIDIDMSTAYTHVEHLADDMMFAHTAAMQLIAHDLQQQVGRQLAKAGWPPSVTDRFGAQPSNTVRASPCNRCTDRSEITLRWVGDGPL